MKLGGTASLKKQSQQENASPVAMAQEQLIQFEFVPNGWRYLDTHPSVKGWESIEILNVYKDKWSDYVSRLEETTPVSFTPESPSNSIGDLISQNTIMVFAYSLALSARGHKKISMLDWGGSIGHYYLLARALLPGVEIEYSCKDVPMIADFGQKLLPNVSFYSDDTCLSKHYDFVLASGSLQYSKDWEKVLEGLARATKRNLLITRFPVLEQHSQFVFIQRAYSYGYNTEYLAWCINRDLFLMHAEDLNLHLVREFVIGDDHEIHNAPEQPKYLGFLFEKKGTGAYSNT